MLKCICKACYH